ncbi:uncharacterized protein LOC110869723 [Helianthus annuus]|uniref:uncharacterized protein LOC110869723 n=1 Tax=Helianthus annuus TaxID=4232 RepID=UPI000B902E9A|nr:uncharacterized protein LOC110869723 [Helianthus annuus]
MNFTAKEVEPLLHANLNIQMGVVQDLLEKKRQVKVSLPKLRRAKMIAVAKLMGTIGPIWGLLPAMAKVFPIVEHRYCLRHIHENMKKTWRGDVYKNLLWRCASATSMPYYERAMEDIKAIDKKLYDWLTEIPAIAWSRAHFSGRVKCDMLLNNICEVFNKQFFGARDKPIITCLEYIREYLTKRIVNVKKIIAKSDGPLSPAATTMFDSIKNEASQYNVLMTGSSNYQVTDSRNKTVVDVQMRTCSCRKWDLIGMPCKHAVAAIWNVSENGLSPGIPESWVDPVYWLDSWKKVYMHTIDPIAGPEMWPRSRCLTKLTPPKYHKQVGRPKKKRKTSQLDVEAKLTKGGKLTRK